MTRLNKFMIYQWLREANCIKSPTLNEHFKSVWVGEVLSFRIKKAKRRLTF
jgi:hypothetical protein